MSHSKLNILEILSTYLTYKFKLKQIPTLTLLVCHTKQTVSIGTVTIGTPKDRHLIFLWLLFPAYMRGKGFFLVSKCHSKVCVITFPHKRMILDRRLAIVTSSYVKHIFFLGYSCTFNSS